MQRMKIAVFDPGTLKLFKQAADSYQPSQEVEWVWTSEVPQLTRATERARHSWTVGHQNVFIPISNGARLQ